MKLMAAGKPAFRRSGAGAAVDPVDYPEAYYRLQPLVSRACDNMKEYPASPEAVENMTGDIYDEACRTYPDWARYARKYDTRSKASSRKKDVNSMFIGAGGFLWALIGVILVGELFRRRRFRRRVY